MRKNPSTAELIENEVAGEAHNLVRQWQADRTEFFKRDVLEIVEDFAGWTLSRRPEAGNALVELAERLTPNPARTPAGTLAVILDGIDKIDDQWLARTLAFVNARGQGLAAVPLTDEQWREGDIHSKLRLLQAARSLKEALREANKL